MCRDMRGLLHFIGAMESQIDERSIVDIDGGSICNTWRECGHAGSRPRLCYGNQGLRDRLTTDLRRGVVSFEINSVS